MFRTIGAAIAALTMTFAVGADAATIIVSDTVPVYTSPEAGGIGKAEVDRTWDWTPRAIRLQTDTTYVAHLKLDTGRFETLSPQIIDLMYTGRVDNWRFYTDYVTPTGPACPSQRCMIWQNAPGEFTMRFHTVNTAETLLPIPPDGSVENTSGFEYKAEAYFTYFAEIIAPGADFVTMTVTITAVPEPATWAMMIVGLGLAGTAIRQRRASALA